MTPLETSEELVLKILFKQTQLLSHAFLFYLLMSPILSLQFPIESTFVSLLIPAIILFSVLTLNAIDKRLFGIKPKWQLLEPY